MFLLHFKTSDNQMKTFLLDLYKNEITGLLVEKRVVQVNFHLSFNNNLGVFKYNLKKPNFHKKLLQII